MICRNCGIDMRFYGKNQTSPGIGYCLHLDLVSHDLRKDIIALTPSVNQMLSEVKKVFIAGIPAINILQELRDITAELRCLLVEMRGKGYR